MARISRNFFSRRVTKSTASNGARLRSTRNESITSTRTPITRGGACFCITAHDGFGATPRNHESRQTGRNLQPRGPEPRGGVVRDAGVHGQRRWARNAADPGGDAGARLEVDAFLPGLELGALRTDQGESSNGDHSVSSALTLCSGEAVRLLDYRQLSRSVRNVCVQRYPVQSRVSDSRRDICDAENHARIGAGESGDTGLRLSGQSGRKTRLGTCERLRGDAVADAAAGPAR